MRLNRQELGLGLSACTSIRAFRVHLVSSFIESHHLEL
jgi:hypothetical protein